MNISNELKKNQIILLEVSDKLYFSEIFNLVKKISAKRICYVTLNKTSSALLETFKEKKINSKNILIIDAITRSLKSTSNNDQVYFVSSPGALTEISITISQFLNYDLDYIIFDSLNNFLTYRTNKEMIKFFSSIISKIRDKKTKAIFFVLKTGDNNNLIEQCGQYVDKLIKARK